MTTPLPERIDAQRLRLRSPVIDDAKVIFESYAQDPLVCRYMIWAPHESEGVTRAFIASCIEA